MKKDEIRFRKENKDIFIPNDFSKVHFEYSNLPEYLRRWCAYKEKVIPTLKNGG